MIPQAIEWAFNVAAQKRFNVSSDNLNGFESATASFKNKVLAQVQLFLVQGFPSRANQFIEALAQFYNTPLPLTIKCFITTEEEKKCLS